MTQAKKYHLFSALYMLATHFEYLQDEELDPTMENVLAKFASIEASCKDTRERAVRKNCPCPSCTAAIEAGDPETLAAIRTEVTRIASFILS